WDIATGTTQQIFRRHTWWVWAAEFSPDGRRIVTAGQDGKAVVWEQSPNSDSTSGVGGEPASLYQPLTEFAKHRGPIYAAQFSPDGLQVATGGYDRRVLLWSPDEVQPIDIERRLDGLDDPPAPFRELAAHRGPVRAVAFSPDGQELASGGQDNLIVIWDVATGKPKRQLRGHASHVRSCSYSPDGRMLLSGGRDNQIKLWRPDRYAEVLAVGETADAVDRDAVLGARFSSDGKYIVAAGRDRTAVLWNADSLELQQRFVEGHDFLTSTAVFFADGSRLATGAGDGTVRIWDVATGSEVHALSGTGRAAALDVSADGRHIATGSSDNAVIIWAGDSGERLTELVGHSAHVTAVRFSPDGRVLVTGDDRGRCRIWAFDPENGQWQDVGELAGHSRSINAIGFVDDGRRVVTASGDNTCGQWDLASRRELSELVLKHPAWVSDMAVSRNGEFALTSCDDGLLRLWSLPGARVLRTFQPQRDDAALTSIDLSPDGRLAAAVSAAEGTVRLWQVGAGEELTTLDDQGAAQAWLSIGRRGGVVWAARFAPGGR
ncbi:MAG: WD40 repeat domain-containing protein, partial [Planctomycetota bacterium]